MQNPPSLPPKPVAKVVRPELTRLPEYTIWRRLLRAALWAAAQALVKLRTRLTVRGLENFPKHGPGLIVFNHLGDADIVVILSQLRTLSVDPFGASDVHEDYGWVGALGDLYGTIWVHRGLPDRRALTCALESLKRGRFVIIAPEGRQSLNQGLEEGLEGAAFLAFKAEAPIIPIALTGTEIDRFNEDYKHWRRTTVTMTVGKPFRLEKTGERHADLKTGTDRIMCELADLLPTEYRGIYRELSDFQSR
jgi:1-acyl-sn-glycerol-3-phosphate acyltransferase